MHGSLRSSSDGKTEISLAQECAQGPISPAFLRKSQYPPESFAVDGVVSLTKHLVALSRKPLKQFREGAMAFHKQTWSKGAEHFPTAFQDIQLCSLHVDFHLVYSSKG